MKKDTVQVLAALAGIIGIISLMIYVPWNKFIEQSYANTKAQMLVEHRTSNDVSEDILLDDDAIMGKPDAPVLIVEFGDFMCPFCGKIHREIEPLWRKEYIETGKARYVFRDIIALNHPQAFVAAEANECAHAQSKQWPMYDLLYDNAYHGDAWSQFSDEKNVTEVMKKYAQQIGLDTTKFEACMTNNTFADEVRQDISAGFQKGITGTPTIYIGNDRTSFVNIRGFQPYAVYKQIIDQTLKEST